MGGIRVGRFALGAGTLLSLALLAGRAAGFLRELVIASTLGTSAEADLAVLLLTLPDLLVNLLLSGGLSVALIPLFRSAAPGHARALFHQAMLLVALVFGALALGLAWWPSPWLRVLAPGGRFELTGEVRNAIALVALAVPLTALAGVTTAWLNALDRYFIAGCGTLMFNVCVVAALLPLPHRGVEVLGWLGWGVLGGALFRWGAQFAALPVGAWRPERGPWLVDRVLIRAFAAAVLSASLMLIVPVVVRALASATGPGAIAAFNYATKLVELPVGILITTLATVAFPRMSELHAAGLAKDARAMLAASLARCGVLAFGVLVAGWCFGDAIVVLLFQRGKIDAASAGHIVELTRVLVLAVPFVGIASLATAYVNAQRRTLEVLRITLLCVVALPVLATPGLWRGSTTLLMGAVVAFHVLLSVAMMRATGLGWLGEGGWIGRRMCFACGAAALTAAVFLAFDRLVDLSAPLWRTLLALAMFSVMSVVGLRFLSNSRGVKNAIGE